MGFITLMLMTLNCMAIQTVTRLDLSKVERALQAVYSSWDQLQSLGARRSKKSQHYQPPKQSMLQPPPQHVKQYGLEGF